MHFSRKCQGTKVVRIKKLYEKKFSKPEFSDFPFSDFSTLKKMRFIEKFFEHKLFGFEFSTTFEE